MKKNLPHLILVLMMICPLAVMAENSVDEIPEGIALSFKAGNASELSAFFYDNIELIILENEDVYSRSQALQILRKFFTEHQPESFTIIHEGGPENSRYAIGNLKTSTGVYRVYLLLRQQGGKALIHQLRIEEEEDE